tara:strand:+ start:3899 stop:5125 length:1227 start_codon:yes stop_codon:yes gene_type:complete
MCSLTFKIPHNNSEELSIENKKEELIKYVKPTLCFATMCKNEEHCIRETLESIYKYIDTWVVHDTGSTDRTCKIVSDFFEEKGISGELYCEEWKGFDYNKTKMFERCYNKCDYILHLDADDVIVDGFEFNVKLPTKDTYYLNTKRGSSQYKCINIWKSSLRWKFCGVAHTIVKCLDKKHYETSDELVCDDVYLHSRSIGNRSSDPDKYLKDAKLLEKQFFDTLYYDPENLNSRSVFYTGQSYLDSGYINDALKWYSLYIKLKNTWVEEIFESYMRIARCLIKLNKSYDDIKKNIDNAINIFSDRAEPYYILGKYCNDNKKNVSAYNLFKTAYSMNLDEVKQKYILFITEKYYGKYILDELSVACYWTNKLDEGKKYLLEIIDDEDFKKEKDRLDKNMKHFNDKLNYIK